MSLEQHTVTDRTDHEIAKVELARQLSQTDKDNRLSGRELAENVPVSESTVRDLIKEIRQEYRLAIYSNGSGYYQIQSVNELESALEKINEEIETRERTKQELAAAFNQ